MSIPHKITITGTIYIKYIDDTETPFLGDIRLLLNNDARSMITGDYENLKISGYIKAHIFDGRVWQNIDIGEFCTDRENKFSKKQRAIDTALLCRDIIKGYKGHIMHKTYRGHFTLNEYEPVEYLRKANRGRK
jgi:hypothetical protein